MATVYLAQDLKHDRKVAIKVLRPELGASLGADRFLQKIRVAGKPRGVLLWWEVQFPHVDALRADPRFQRVVDESRPPEAR